MAAEMRDMYKQLRDVKQADRYERYYALRRELWEKVERRVQDVLLDHQRDRLRQIVLQMQLRSYGFGANVLASDTLAKELGITAEQKARLQSAQRAALGEYRQKTQEFQRQLMKEMVEKVLAELTPGQRQKLDKMMGDPYEPRPVVLGGN
jgi:bisphosphoglycerate-independent phosphoglycerate mutase (AlkP superfamily)